MYLLFIYYMHILKILQDFKIPLSIIKCEISCAPKDMLLKGIRTFLSKELTLLERFRPFVPLYTFP